MKLALSTLCENPHQRTGLSTFFPEFVRNALVVAPEIEWVIFVGAGQPWNVEHERVEVIRAFPSNERRLARLVADQFFVGPAARRRGAEALLTVGFMPIRTGGLPVVMHVVAIPSRRGGGLRGIYRGRMVAHGLRRARLVIVNSRWASDQVGTARAPVLVSHEGVQGEHFHAAGPAGLAHLPPQYLLWAGNFYPYKRAPFALSAYAGLPAEVRARFPFVLVGGDWHGGRAQAETAARALGIESHTHFLGWVDDADLPALYRGARAHVLSTTEETFGRSVLEAMACGCPSVLQDLPVLREVAAEAALYTDFLRPDAATAALARICTDDTLRATLRSAGLRRAAGFSFEKLARERLDAIVKALGEGRRA